MRLLVIVALLLFALAAACAFGVISGASLSVVVGLVACGLAVYMLALASSSP